VFSVRHLLRSKELSHLRQGTFSARYKLRLNTKLQYHASSTVDCESLLRIHRNITACVKIPCFPGKNS